MKSSAKKITGSYYFFSPDLPIALKQVQGKIVTHPHDYTATPHYHDFAELIIITGGSGVQMIDGRCYMVQTGDVFVILDETAHSFSDYNTLKITNIMFDCKVLASYEQMLARIPGYQILFRLEPELRRSGREFRNKLHLPVANLTEVIKLLREMEKEQQECAPGFEAAISAGFIRLVILLSRSLDEHTVPSDSVTQLGSLLSSLSVNFSAEWDLAKMAKLCSMSVNTLLRHFQLAMNKSPMQYLTQLRLEHACSLLLKSNLNIGSIAQECGFRDSNYFAKKFRAVYGVTATDFRKKNISRSPK